MIHGLHALYRFFAAITDTLNIIKFFLFRVSPCFRLLPKCVWSVVVGRRAVSFKIIDQAQMAFEATEPAPLRLYRLGLSE